MYYLSIQQPPLDVVINEYITKHYCYNNYIIVICKPF